jgi:hypothetical protein
MRPILIAAMAAVCSQAAVIRGVVVENLTSKPLARARLTVQPVAGTPGATRSVRADAHGGFVFVSLTPGAYIVKATRSHFMPSEYGQKCWNSAGMPVILEEGRSVFLNIRLLRYSAISGTLLDENDEGLPSHEVIAYRNSKPPEIVAHAISDERGIYRLHGLEPGNYTVRSAGEESSEGSFLPTFAKETGKLEQARTVDLLPEQDASDIDVRPMEGRLYSISTIVEKIPPGADVALTLVSDTGRRRVVAAGGTYRFSHLPPGDYDLFAQSPAEAAAGSQFVGAYQRVALGADTGVTLILRSASAVTISGAGTNMPMELRLRPGDLAGAGPPSVLPVTNGMVTIPVGRWEALLDPPAGYYVSGLAGSVASLSGANRMRPDGWQEILSPGYGGVRFLISGGASAVHGIVKGPDGAVSGAPVYLEAYNLIADQRVADLRAAATDIYGQYRFDGLAPGTYRILATFEYISPDAETMGVAGALALTLDAHSELARDLDLYTIR